MPAAAPVTLAAVDRTAPPEWDWSAELDPAREAAETKRREDDAAAAGLDCGTGRAPPPVGPRPHIKATPAAVRESRARAAAAAAGAVDLLRESDAAWSARQVEAFPRTWQAQVMAGYLAAHAAEPDAANRSLLVQCRNLSDAARGGIAPDAGDAEICAQAELTAADFTRRLAHIQRIAGAFKDGAPAWLYSGYVVRVQAFCCRALLAARGLLDLWPATKKNRKVSRAGAVARMQCARWWRRAYRKLHARTVEACGIALGLVSRDAGLYASDEACTRRAAQNIRNAATLESVTAVNENGQDFTLAELAAKGTANKAIRRVELLTRIAGFELIAKECGHAAYMVTVTCPSRFHRKRISRAGLVLDNPKFDGSTPDAAQKYLSRQWSRARAAAARAGLAWYGFRIAEPQHDATPHWHCLLFFPPGARGTNYRQLVSIIRRYFWRNETPAEPGAKKHRCDFERIDWRKGSAVGYVIKYVSKNIDGNGVGLDLFGNDAITSSARVEAWASTWRIRQFQQIGGAPVTIWRELRRLHPENLGDNAPDELRAALSAINTAKVEPGIQALAWKKYIGAQGGIGTPRAAQPLKLAKEQTGEIGRYGEPMGAAAVGIFAAGVRRFTSHVSELIGRAVDFTKGALSEVASERSTWLIATGAQAVEVARALVSKRRQAPRIHVNNCTAPTVTATGEAILSGRETRWGYLPDCVSAFRATRERRDKLGRSPAWPTKTRPAPAAGVILSPVPL